MDKVRRNRDKIAVGKQTVDAHGESSKKAKESINIKERLSFTFEEDD